MKKTKTEHPYFFNFDEEYALYNQIGEPGARFSKYTEWHDYVYAKYSAYKDIPKNLVSFKHFLICNTYSATSLKEENAINSPWFFSSYIALLASFAFGSLASSSFLPENTPNWFYAICYLVLAIFIYVIVIVFFMLSKRYIIKANNTVRFYDDYIKIIDEILNSTYTMKGALTMPLPQEQTYTTGDIYALQSSVRSELPPSRKHQYIVTELCTIINCYIKSNNGSCEVYTSPFAVFLNEDDKNYVEPDISVICDKSKLTDNGCSGAPDWIIEVVSPGSRRMDYYTKLFKYSTAGVREYWIVDPEKNRITVYDLEHEDMTVYTSSDTVKAGIYSDLSIDFKNLNI